MLKKDLDKRRKFWKKFEAWENNYRPIKGAQSDIYLIGEMVDFYLKKYPKTKKVLGKNYGKGIIQLHKNLSLLVVK